MSERMRKMPRESEYKDEREGSVARQGKFVGELGR